MKFGTNYGKFESHTFRQYMYISFVCDRLLRFTSIIFYVILSYATYIPILYKYYCHKPDLVYREENKGLYRALFLVLSVSRQRERDL